MSSGQKNQTEALSRKELPATGERFVTQKMGEHIQVAYEHLHRYLVAQECCRGKDVLDIASGEGYGSNILAQSAKSVLGVDISEDAVQFARQKYTRPNMRFSKGDCTKIPLGKHSVDVVVSFETIEHILQQEAFIIEIRRVLRPGGLLIISSPDKHEYSDRSGYTNPFHVAELYRADFLRLLKRHFKNCRSLQQRLIAGSYIAADADSKTDVCYGTHRGNLLGGTFNEGVHEGLYTVAFCSDQKLPEILAGVFENRGESARIWHAFEELDNVRADMETLRGYLEDERRRIRECEAEKLRAQTHYQELSLRYDNLEGALRKQQEESTQQILTLQARAKELDQEAVARGEWGKRLDGEIDSLRAIVGEQRAIIEKLERQETPNSLELGASRASSASNTEAAEQPSKSSDSRQNGLIEEREKLSRQADNLTEQVLQLDKELGIRKDNALQFEHRLIQLEAELADREFTYHALVTEKNQLVSQNQVLVTGKKGSDEDQALLKQRLQELTSSNKHDAARISELEAEKLKLTELHSNATLENTSLSEKLAAIHLEKDKLLETQSGLAEELRTLLLRKEELEASVYTVQSNLLNEQDAHNKEKDKHTRELGLLKAETDALLAVQHDLLEQVRALEEKSRLLEQARDQATTTANDSQNLLEQFVQHLSSALETARSEITCLNQSQVVHITETDLSETSQSPMQTELCNLKTKSEEILQQMDSDQQATRDQLKEATIAVRSLSQEKTNLQAQIVRINTDWTEAEKQVLDAQEQVLSVLTEAESKLHWAASLDKDLCSMRKAVVERDEVIEKQKAQYQQLEETLKQAQQQLAERENRMEEQRREAGSQLDKARAEIQQLQAASTQVQNEAATKYALAHEEVEKRLAQLGGEAELYSKQLKQIKGSLAWKASAPLRMFSKDLSDKKTT